MENEIIKRKENDMKRTIRLMALVLVFAAMLTLLMGCDRFVKSDEDLIRERLDALMEACNSGDLDAMLDCLDKSSRKTYSALFSIGNSLLGGLTGIDIDVRDVMAVILGFSPQDFFEMQIESIDFDSEETATVTVTVSFTDPQTGEKISQEGLELPMIKEKRDWYINAKIDWNQLM